MSNNSHFAQNLENRRDRSPKHDIHDQVNYSSTLAEQVRIKEELSKRQKAEELLTDQNNSRQWDEQHRREQVTEAERKQAIKDQYRKELQDQVDANAQRKLKEAQLHRDERCDPEGGFQWSRPKSADERQRDQETMKEELDLLINQKKMMKEAQQQETHKFNTEMNKIYHDGEMNEKAAQAQQKAKLMEYQQDYIDFLAHKKGGKEAEPNSNLGSSTINENREAERVALKSAQQQLGNDSQRDWDKQIQAHENAKTRNTERIQQEAADMNLQMKQMILEDEEKQQKKRDINKQYQQDLLDQMKSKK